MVRLFARITKKKLLYETTINRNKTILRQLLLTTIAFTTHAVRQINDTTQALPPGMLLSLAPRRLKTAAHHVVDPCHLMGVAAYFLRFSLHGLSVDDLSVRIVTFTPSTGENTGEMMTMYLAMPSKASPLCGGDRVQRKPYPLLWWDLSLGI